MKFEHLKYNYYLTHNTINNIINNTRGTTMKHLNFLYLGLSCLLVLLVASTQTYAAGTPAGTVIKNVATMTYKDLAGNSFTPDTASVTTTVLQVAGVTVLPTPLNQTVGDSVDVFYSIQVKNTGNGTDQFPLTDATTQSYSWVFYKDTNRDGILESGEYVPGNIITSTGSLTEDSTLYLIAEFRIPDGATSGTVDSLKVTATSAYTGSVKSTGTYVTTVMAARLSLTKNASPNNPQPGSGNPVTYTINYQNTGTGTATSVVFTDTLNTNLTYVSGSASNSGSFSSGVITWNFARIAGGASGSVTFQAFVKDSVPSTTVINNVANTSFTDSTDGHTRTSNSPPVPITVATKEGLNVTITPLTNPFAPITDSVDVALSGVFRLVITNNANHTDDFKIDTTHSGHFPFKIYTDVNGNGTFDPGTDTLVNLADIASFTQNQSRTYLAVDTIPHSWADLLKDTANYKFTSLANASANQTVTGITVVRAPIMTLQKLVDKATAKPKDTLTYTVNYSNLGHGAASAIVISDFIPANTAFVSGSIWLNSTNLLPDGTYYDGTAITVNVGTVNEGTSGYLKFKVVIQ